jgi:hypothetical protein
VTNCVKHENLISILYFANPAERTSSIHYCVGAFTANYPISESVFIDSLIIQCRTGLSVVQRYRYLPNWFGFTVGGTGLLGLE